MLVAALEYTKRGWPIFPCNQNKTPMTENGFYDATIDEQQIRQWWTKWPNANVGIPTGKRPGFFVLDVDLPDGPESLKQLTDIRP